jgi:hypothetical protein
VEYSKDHKWLYSQILDLHKKCSSLFVQKHQGKRQTLFFLQTLSSAEIS